MQRLNRGGRKTRGGGGVTLHGRRKKFLESFLVLQGRPKHGWWQQRWLRHDRGSGQSGG